MGSGEVCCVLCRHSSRCQDCWLSLFSYLNLIHRLPISLPFKRSVNHQRFSGR
jgi:hypothetical protein